MGDIAHLNETDFDNGTAWTCIAAVNFCNGEADCPSDADEYPGCGNMSFIIYVCNVFILYAGGSET